MKILVCISSVPDTTSKINFTADKSALDKNGIQWVINPLDEFVLSKAVKLQSLGAKITVISIGEAEVDTILRKALAMGADDAIRVNCSPKDSFSAAQEIANVAKNNAYDLILCGKESIDYNGGAVPGMVAQILDIPFVNASIGLDVEGTEAKVTREIEGGKEVVAVKLPALIAGQKGLVDEKEIIIPNMRGIMSARTKPLQVLEPSGNNPQTKSVSFESTPPRASVRLVEPDNLDELVRLLHQEAKVI